MANATTFFKSSLPGLTQIYTDTRGAQDGAPGTVYFAFNGQGATTQACIKASKSWELYCVKQVPQHIEKGKCFGFAVRPEEKGQAKISTLVDLIARTNYWMGGTSKEQDRQIPVSEIDPTWLKERDFNVPQKDYGQLLGQFGLKLAIENPYQEPQSPIPASSPPVQPSHPYQAPTPNQQTPNQTAQANINKAFELFINSLPNSPQIQKDAKLANDKLMADLMQCPVSALRDAIIQKAVRGVYSDFHSPLAAPKMQLIADLQAAGLNQLAQNALQGMYDD